MSNKTTIQVLADLTKFYADFQSNPIYPSEMRLIADSLEALQDELDKRQSARFAEIEALIPGAAYELCADIIKAVIQRQE